MKTIKVWAIEKWNGGSHPTNLYVSDKKIVDEWVKHRSFGYAEEMEFVIHESYEELMDYMNHEKKQKALDKLTDDEKVLLGLK